MSDTETKPVAKRAIFFIGGFDPKSPDAFFKKMDRENERFESLWDAEVVPGEIETVTEDVSRVRYQTRPSATDAKWMTRTDFNFLSLDDIVLKDFGRPFLIRLWRYLVAYWDYVLTGTAYRFIKHAWRFALYFFYPALLLTTAFLASLLLGGVVNNLDIPLSGLAALLGFLATFTACVKLGGNRYHVLHLMDLWSFSRDFLRRDREDIESKLDRLADTILDATRNGEYDEIIMVGHSTGGALILDAAGRAYEKDREFENLAGSISVLTVGSTALKIGLHQAAGWFRTRVKNLMTNSTVNWIEYQCLTDVINFHRTNPSALMSINSSPDKPVIKDIKIKAMLDSETYKRIKRNFFRVHYQFVFGNTKRYHYDFPAICFGPSSLLTRVNNPASHFTSLDGCPAPEVAAK